MKVHQPSELFGSNMLYERTDSCSSMMGRLANGAFGNVAGLIRCFTSTMVEVEVDDDLAGVYCIVGFAES